MNIENPFAVQQARRLQHPLLRRQPELEIQPPPITWQEWLTAFEAATSTVHLTGLLHGGFDVGHEYRSYQSEEFLKRNEERPFFT